MILPATGTTLAALLFVAPASAEPVAPAPDPVWDALAACESHGQWDYDPATADWGNRLFEGGLQFHTATWDAFKHPGMPDGAHQASRRDQIAVAEDVLAVQGWRAWPRCSIKLGLR